MFKRLITAISLFVIGLKDKRLNIHTAELMLGVFGFLEIVVKEKKPFMTRLFIIMPDGDKKDVISLWACSGVNNDPTKRIEELLKEIEELKKLVEVK